MRSCEDTKTFLVGETKPLIHMGQHRGTNGIVKGGMLPDYCEATLISSKCIAACLGITYQTGLTSRGEADLDRVPMIQRPLSFLANESPVEQPLPVERKSPLLSTASHRAIDIRPRVGRILQVIARVFPLPALPRLGFCLF